MHKQGAERSRHRRRHELRIVLTRLVWTCIAQMRLLHLQVMMGMADGIRGLLCWRLARLAATPPRCAQPAQPDEEMRPCLGGTYRVHRCMACVESTTGFCRAAVQVSTASA